MGRLLPALGIVLAAIAAPPNLTNTARAADKPNIVFILADDQGWHQAGCYGSSFYLTPNIDRVW